MGGTGMGLGMWLFWILFILLVVLVIKVLVYPGAHSNSGNDDYVMKILKERYVSGEINQEKFECLKRDLR